MRCRRRKRCGLRARGAGRRSQLTSAEQTAPHHDRSVRKSRCDRRCRRARKRVKFVRRRNSDREFVRERDEHIAVGERSLGSCVPRENAARRTRKIVGVPALLERRARGQHEVRETRRIGEKQIARNDERHVRERVANRNRAKRMVQNGVDAEQREDAELPVTRRCKHAGRIESAATRQHAERFRTARVVLLARDETRYRCAPRDEC